MGKSVVETSAAEQLRAAGIKVTSARVRVLDLLAETSQPVCHAELEARLDIDRVTLYRVLDSLIGCGLAARSTDNRGVFRFAVAAVQRQHAAHAHFRCTGCGAVFCLDAPPPPPPKLPRGFKADAVEFDVRGRCALCNQAKGVSHHGKA
jgi:Fur family transcriptional regulator, ferric uptake regulator